VFRVLRIGESGGCCFERRRRECLALTDLQSAQDHFHSDFITHRSVRVGPLPYKRENPNDRTIPFGYFEFLPRLFSARKEVSEVFLVNADGRLSRIAQHIRNRSDPSRLFAYLPRIVIRSEIRDHCRHLDRRVRP
jgi:hypothetical protein